MIFHRKKVSLMTGLLLFSCILILMQARGAEAATTWANANWTIVNSGNPSTVDSRLQGVVALSEQNVWAVGGFLVTGGSPSGRTLIEHWSGSRWRTVDSPNAGNGNNFLMGVAGRSADDVWAVGEFSNSGGGGGHTLIEHWNGWQWQIVDSPNVGTGNNLLNAVTVLSKKNAWAVGEYFDTAAKVYRTLTEHWNGWQWQVVPSVNPGTNNNFLNGVVAIAPDKVWAVGSYSNAGGFSNTLTEFWNGSQWTLVTSQNRAGESNYLNAVTATSPDNVWAVGNSSGATPTLIEHWNGTQWSIVTSPTPTTGVAVFNGIAAANKDNIWAVGYYFNAAGVIQTLGEHWNGSNWQVAATPNAGTGENMLNAISVAKDAFWSVGFFMNTNNTTYTLTMVQDA